MNNIMQTMNGILQFPTKENIFYVFDTDGYIRLNMLYISPIALKHLKEKLCEFGLISWILTENEMLFKLDGHTISFRGQITFTFKDSKIFCMELDFDPIISDNGCRAFLKDIEVFLKRSDACFFMTFFMSIDSEILDHPLADSVRFLISRR
ncbi:hypothetical protein GINT2_000317 [Glugoides intestinalis]